MDSPKISKVLIIGSGPIIIGQAAEFDYAGSQACRALREEGVTTVLVNSNPATIMTDEGIADIVYIEPLTVDVVERIIQRERPQGLLPTLGGQTGLNLAVALADAGVLDRYDVALLGTPLETIRQAEDRALFRQLLLDIGEPVPEGATVRSMEEAREAAKSISLPLVVRPAYTLGGTGGGIATTPEELESIVTGGLAASPIDQALLERSLVGWKELEYEVMRDGAGQLHHSVRHGEHRPDGRAHGRQHCGGPEPDAHRQRVPDATERQPEDHPSAGHRGRVQHPVRPGSASVGWRLSCTRMVAGQTRATT